MRTRGLKFWIPGIAVSALSFLGGMLSMMTKVETGLGAVLWLPVGIGFTALFLLGLEFWPWVLLGELLLSIWAHYTPVEIIFTAAISTSMNYFSARFLRQHLSRLVTFSRLNELFLFLAVGCLITPLSIATIQVALHYFCGDLPADKLFFTWRTWWTGQGMSTLILGGLIIHGVNDIRHWKPLFYKRRWEALLLVCVILGSSIFIFTPLAVHNHTLVIKPYFLFSLMLWASLRFDLLGTTVTAFILVGTAMAGNLFGYVAFSSSVDIPENRMLVLQFLIATTTLTGMIVATTVREKSEALDARNEFLDIASHELKTPITSLKLQLELLQRRLDKKTDLTPAEAEQGVFLKKVDRQVNRLVKIVEQLLDVSRAERKIMELDREEVKLNELVQNLLDRLSGDIQNAKCSLKLDLQREISGHWDPFRLEQVLENLLSNAIKYAPGKMIEFSTSEKNGIVEIGVKDYGPGIPHDKQHAIFDRFIRAAETRHVQGLGLGLFITRRIVEAHGGSIKVKSAPGEGALFVVHIPVKTV